MVMMTLRAVWFTRTGSLLLGAAGVAGWVAAVIGFPLSKLMSGNTITRLNRESDGKWPIAI